MSQDNDESTESFILWVERKSIELEHREADLESQIHQKERQEKTSKLYRALVQYGNSIESTQKRVEYIRSIKKLVKEYDFNPYNMECAESQIREIALVDPRLLIMFARYFIDQQSFKAWYEYLDENEPNLLDFARNNIEKLHLSETMVDIIKRKVRFVEQIDDCLEGDDCRTYDAYELMITGPDESYQRSYGRPSETIYAYERAFYWSQDDSENNFWADGESLEEELRQYMKEWERDLEEREIAFREINNQKTYSPNDSPNNF